MWKQYAIVLGLLSIVACALYAQAPVPASCDPESKVQFICTQDAPEDLAVVSGSKWVLASSFASAGPGGIRAIQVSDQKTVDVFPTAAPKERLDTKIYGACPGPLSTADKAKLRTHGLYLRVDAGATHTLFAVHHGDRESIEVFEVDPRPAVPVLTWIGCVVAPDPIGLNSVAGLSDGGFITTNYQERGAGSRGSQTKMMAGENNGELWEWHPGGMWTKIPGSESSGANGIEFSKDGKWIYLAEWGSQDFVRLSRGTTPVKRDVVKLGFRIDNVRWALDGMLFGTGQGGTAPMQTTSVVKIDPDTLKVTEVIRQPYTAAFSAGTVAVQVGKEIWVGSYRGDRIARFPQ